MKKNILSSLFLICICLIAGCKQNGVKGGGELKLDKTLLDMQAGTSYTFTVSPKEQVTWSSSDEKVAFVDQDGKIEAKTIGKAVITAKAGSKQASCTITVGQLLLDSETLRVPAGRTREIKATVLVSKDFDKKVVWTSKDTKIASVKDGIVTGISEGETEIIAQNGGKTAKCALTVTKALDCDLKIEISDIKPANAKFKITPSKKDATFVYEIYVKHIYERALKARKCNDVFELAKKWYTYLKEQSTSLSDKTWQYAAKQAGDFYKTGVQEGEIFECVYGLEFCRPETDLIIFYYLINEDSEAPESEIFVKEFKTAPAAVTSNNKINIDITKTYFNGVDATITSTDQNDFYFISFQSQYYVDGGTTPWKNRPVDMAYNLIGAAKKQENGLFSLWKGNKKITPEDIQVRNQQGNRPYYLIYFSYNKDDGVCSEVKWIPFTTAEAPKDKD